MTKEYLDKMGYDYRFADCKPKKKDLEEIKNWRQKDKFIGLFRIGNYWYVVFDGMR